MDTSLKKEKPAILDLYIPPPPAVPYSPRYVSVPVGVHVPVCLEILRGGVEAVRVSRGEAAELPGDRAES